MGTFVGYARVSTIDQDLDLQVDELKALGCKNVFTDKVSCGLLDRLCEGRLKSAAPIGQLDLFPATCQAFPPFKLPVLYGRIGRGSFLGLMEPVALAVCFENVDSMGKPVEKGSSETLELAEVFLCNVGRPGPYDTSSWKRSMIEVRLAAVLDFLPNPIPAEKLLLPMYSRNLR
jgi:hypothetical protein